MRIALLDQDNGVVNVIVADEAFAASLGTPYRVLAEGEAVEIGQALPAAEVANG